MWRLASSRGTRRNASASMIEFARSTAFWPSDSPSASRNVASETKPNDDQQLADRLVGLHLLQQRDAQLVLADHALRDQDLANGAAAGW
jgi:hypothetical protein